MDVDASSGAAASCFVVKRGDHILGRFSETELLQKYRAGEVANADLVMVEGRTGWHPLDTYIAVECVIPTQSRAAPVLAEAGPARAHPLWTLVSNRPARAGLFLIGLGIACMNWPWLFYGAFFCAAFAVGMWLLIQNRLKAGALVVLAAATMPFLMWHAWLRPAKSSRLAERPQEPSPRPPVARNGEPARRSLAANSPPAKTAVSPTSVIVSPTAAPPAPTPTLALTPVESSPKPAEAQVDAPKATSRSEVPPVELPPPAAATPARNRFNEEQFREAMTARFDRGEYPDLIKLSEAAAGAVPDNAFAQELHEATAELGKALGEASAASASKVAAAREIARYRKNAEVADQPNRLRPNDTSGQARAAEDRRKADTLEARADQLASAAKAKLEEARNRVAALLHPELERAARLEKAKRDRAAEKIKGTRLLEQPATTLGRAFDGYPFMKSTDWDVKELSNGITTGTISCRFDGSKVHVKDVASDLGRLLGGSSDTEKTLTEDKLEGARQLMSMMTLVTEVRVAAPGIAEVTGMKLRAAMDGKAGDMPLKPEQIEEALSDIYAQRIPTVVLGFFAFSLAQP
jgi:hypothetical protein